MLLLEIIQSSTLFNFERNCLSYLSISFENEGKNVQGVKYLLYITEPKLPHFKADERSIYNLEVI